MIRNQQVQERWRKCRLDGKSIETMFQNRLIEEARCSPIVARAIWGIVNQMWIGGVDPDSEAARVGPVVCLAVAAEEPAGKPLRQCQKVTVRLTLDAGPDDQEVRWRHGLDGVRRARILRPLPSGFSYFALNPWRLKRVSDIMSDQSRALRVRTFVHYLKRHPDAGGYLYIGSKTRAGLAPTEPAHPARFATTFRRLAIQEFDALADHGHHVAKAVHTEFGLQAIGPCGSATRQTT